MDQEIVNFVPTILKKAKKKQLLQVGEGNNKVDLCYIEDCVQAHILAIEALDMNPDSRGRPYFISQGEPVKLWDWINEVLENNNLEKISKKISYKLAYSLASILEFISNILPNKPEPRLTKFLVSEMATHHYFDISASKKELKYSPKFSIREAMESTFTSSK